MIFAAILCVTSSGFALNDSRGRPGTWPGPVGVCRIGPENESPRSREQLPCESQPWFSILFRNGGKNTGGSACGAGLNPGQKTLISP